MRTQSWAWPAVLLVWATCLSAASRAATLARWPFDEANGRAVRDVSGNSNHGDTSGDVTSGNFTLNTAGDIATKAMTYLSALYSGGGAGYQTAAATWLDAPLGYGQDQMALMPVPEPTSLALCGLGLLGLAGAIRRKRRATRAVPTA